MPIPKSWLEGRLAVTLTDHQEVVIYFQACHSRYSFLMTRYRNSRGKNVKPKWKKGDEDKYRPSYNKAPQSFCPVLLHARHLEKDNPTLDGNTDGHERVIVSMKWGLVPSWVKVPSQAQYKMNNARSDSMLEKASYKRPLVNGQRCVVLADGFYEWNTTKTEKQPYYIYFKDGGDSVLKNKVKSEDKENGDDEETSKRLVTMAGIFERRKSPDDEDDLYTFSVITVDAHPAFSWLHHRMPAMLENDEEVQRWLNYGEVPLQEAVELIKPKDCLTWYPVSKFVNNSRNNSPECMEEIDLEKAKATKESKESKGMAKWLAKTPTKVKSEASTPEESKTEEDAPKVKQEANKEEKLQMKEESKSPQKSEQQSPTKRGRKRKSSGSATLMQGWLKKANKE